MKNYIKIKGIEIVVDCLCGHPNSESEKICPLHLDNCKDCEYLTGILDKNDILKLYDLEDK